jgi:hypothetical protein
LSKELDKYEDKSKLAGYTIFSCFSPTLLEAAFVEFCDKDTIAYEPHAKKYKIKFTKQGTT